MTTTNPIVIDSDSDDDYDKYWTFASDDDDNDTSPSVLCSDSDDNDDDNTSHGSKPHKENPDVDAVLLQNYDETQRYLESIPEANQPLALMTPLLPHQKQALHWLLERESNPHCSGGILADDMGVGKTMETLALICQNHHVEQTLIVCPVTMLSHWRQEIIKHSMPGFFENSICLYYGDKKPQTLEQLKLFRIVITTYGTICAERKYWLKTGYFSDESLGVGVVKESHFVPSYIIAAAKNRLLYQNCWGRIVLDEAQYIRNQSTASARSCYALTGTSRFCLSGTPIVNSLDDFYSLLRFIRLPRFCNYDTFRSLISGPISADQQDGYKRLAALMKECMLRRRKNQKLFGRFILDLPETTANLIKLPFEPSDLEFYKHVEKSLIEQFKSIVQRGRQYVMQNYTFVLVLLLRMRQAVCHPYLVVANYQSTDELEKQLTTTTSDGSSSSGKKKKCLNFDLLEALTQGIAPSSPCYTPPDVDMASFQNQFVEKESKRVKKESPVLSSDQEEEEEVWLQNGIINIDTSSSESPSSENEDTLVQSNGKKRKRVDDEQQDNMNNTLDMIDEKVNFMPTTQRIPRRSTKITALIAALALIRPKEDDKIVIYSQFTSYMDLVELVLAEEGWRVLRLDGTMRQQVRESAIHTFNTDPTCRIFLVSLKAGGVGLNLTVANHLFLLDPWWNSAVQEQAIDRVRRIGQKKHITVTRFVIENSIEDRILTIQAQKDKIIDRALANHRGDRAAPSGLNFKQLCSLFTSSL